MLDASETRLDGMLAVSDFDTSTRLLEALVLRFVIGIVGTVEARCIQRSRTPSTALKKPVVPAVTVRDTASRAGASCWSSLRS